MNKTFVPSLVRKEPMADVSENISIVSEKNTFEGYILVLSLNSRRSPSNKCEIDYIFP
jgi:hypothetical protein